MKILQIVEAAQVIRSNLDLANAFNENEWMRIVNHFVVANGIWNGTLGSDEQQIQRRMDLFNFSLGKDMEEGAKTPSSWNLAANRYGMSIPKSNVSWQDIYDHLAPYATSEMPENWTVQNIAATITSGDTIQTGELGEINNWLGDPQVTSWDNWRAVRNGPIRSFTQNMLAARSEEWKTWYNLEGNHQPEQLFTVLSEIRDIVTETGSIERQQIASKLHAWLRSVDIAERNYRRQR